MGCICSNNPCNHDLYPADNCSSISSINGVPRLVLSQSQKQSIRTTWKYLQKNMSNIGTIVLLRIFMESPEVKELFPFHNVWGDRLLNHPVFRDHAFR